jgi:hypothetical protein
MPHIALRRSSTVSGDGAADAHYAIIILKLIAADFAHFFEGLISSSPPTRWQEPSDRRMRR